MDELANRRRQRATASERQAHLTRVGRLAKTEGMAAAELTDAVRQLALDHPMTEAAVLDLVDEHGLEGAIQAIAESAAGG